jgi:mannitol/fructose-specific phosphotransferase system IIA component (Ntr-type)
MSMRLKTYVHPECFIHDLAAKTREEALREMVSVTAAKGIIKDQAAVLESLLERERIQSTAVGSGIAIPHCFTDEVADLVIVVARAPGGIAFDSFDGRPTHVVFLLMGNRQEHGLHLKALARIARLIKSTAFIDRVVAADSVEGMVRAFEEEEAKI